MPSMLTAAVLSVTKLEDAFLFYRDILGFTPSAEFTLRGDAFARHWAVPTMTARGPYCPMAPQALDDCS